MNLLELWEQKNKDATRKVEFAKSHKSTKAKEYQKRQEKLWGKPKEIKSYAEYLRESEQRELERDENSSINKYMVGADVKPKMGKKSSHKSENSIKNYNETISKKLKSKKTKKCDMCERLVTPTLYKMQVSGKWVGPKKYFCHLHIGVYINKLAKGNIK